ncbi:MAG: hypothetical protein AB7S41_02530 [Parvibaculaceae bacterium]
MADDDRGDEAAQADDFELQRLRERVEMQFRHIETITRALGERVGHGTATTLRPMLPARSTIGRLDPVPAMESVNWWPASAWPSQPLVPSPGFAALSLAGRTLPVMAVIVLGLAGPALDAVIQTISARQRRALDFKPVFLTSSSDFTPFRILGFAFEYLPQAIYGAAPHARPTPRAAARMKLLQQKWEFDSVIDLTPRSAGGEAPDPSPAAPTERGGIQAMPETLEERAALIRDSGLLDAAWYRATYPEVGGADPALHYLTKGAAKGYDPSPVFLTAYYARQMLARGL